MKFALNRKTTKKILIGSAIFNYVLLVTYICLLLSTFLEKNYLLFIIGIPAYILSENWLLLIGIFGFEVCLILYWFVREKKIQQKSQTTFSDNSLESFTALDNEINLEEQIDSPKKDLTIVKNHSNSFLKQEEKELLDSINFDRLIDGEELLNESFPEKKKNLTKNKQFNSDSEIELDNLWEEAIKHVEAATRKKTSKSVTEPYLTTADKLNKKKIREDNKSITQNVQNNQRKKIKQSRAYVNNNQSKPSPPSPTLLIKPEHREFYNEITLNNWIYESKQHRKNFGVLKPALDESKLQKKELDYMLAAGLLYKLIIPFRGNSFVIYSIYENEDKKILHDYLVRLCKKYRFSLKNRTFSFNEYRDLQLDKKQWRFDFIINEKYLGLIWVSNFLIHDTGQDKFTLTYKCREEFKALIAAVQLYTTEQNNLKAIILTDYKKHADILRTYAERVSLGQVYILSIAEKSFEEKIKKLGKVSN